MDYYYIGGAAAALFVYAFYGAIVKRPLPKASVSVGNKEEGQTGVRRRVGHEQGLMTIPNDDVTTLYELLKRSSSKYASRRCMGTRSVVETITEEIDVINTVNGEEKKEKKKMFYSQLSEYQWKTYSEVFDEVSTVGAALVSEQIGLTPGNSKLGIFCNTCPEWIRLAHACFTQSISVVTVYANLGEEGLIHAVKEGELTHIFCNAELLPLLVRVAAACPSIKQVIYVDEAKHEHVQKLSTTVRVISYNDLVKLGEPNKKIKHIPPKADDIAFIMYTSGTTGTPKGVIMTHANVVGAIAGAGTTIDFYDSDVYIAYLPLAHILELVIEHLLIYYGTAIGYGSPRSLSDTTVRKCKGDLRELRPTLMAGVPAVWERIRKGAMSKIEKGSPAVRFIFNMAYKYKSMIIKNGHSTPILDALIFKKFRDNVGGRVRGMLSGGAPISHEAHQFLRVCFCAPVIQGYGLTECCGVATIMDLLTDYNYERVGAPVSSMEVKLIDVPDMKYFSTDKPRARGEVLIRGTNVCTNGYYKNEQKTKEDFDHDGWFHTGDIGQINSDGTFSIIDRKKNLVKLSHGEYIALEKLESVYKGSKLVENVLVYGDSQKDFPVAVVVPVKSELEAWAKGKGISVSNYEKLCKEPEAQKMMLNAFKDAGRQANLKTYESVQKVMLTADEWTPENDLVTAAQKIKRQPIVEKYRKEIDALYK